MNLLGCNQGWVLEGKVQGSGCEGAGMAVQMLSWGLPLGKEAEIELWVGKREDPPPCGLLARRALSLLSMVWPGRGYSPGGRVWEDQRLRGVKAQILILAWRKPIPSATLWLAGRVGGSRIKGRVPRPAQQLPSSGASLGGGARSGSWSPPHSTGVGPWKGQDRGIFPKNPSKKSVQEKPDDLFKARER